jgi:hypothetical protein
MPSANERRKRTSVGVTRPSKPRNPPVDACPGYGTVISCVFSCLYDLRCTALLRVAIEIETVAASEIATLIEIGIWIWI